MSAFLNIVRHRLLTRENAFALGICVILILVVIITADTAPQWIYQGF